jgi:glycosyltransferase involved in cell wall biosynthesis
VSPVIGWVGRLTPQKDPEMLLQALARVLEVRADAVAVLVGDGPLRSDVVQWLSRAGIEDRVKLLGVRRDVRRLYPGFDLVLHVSRWEGQPLVVQEAVAERIPVVATRVTGVGELIEPGVTGWLVEQGDLAALCERALSVLDDPALRPPVHPQQPAAARGREQCLQGHDELYRRLLGRDQ